MDSHEIPNPVEKACNNPAKCKGISIGRPLSAAFSALRRVREKPLNGVELKAISAMIAYVAYQQKTDETTVREILAARFGVNEVSALPSRLYQNAIEYLADLQISCNMN